ncbi:MAG TPA: methyltransferase domain-containing protein [Candidatus Binataceae bacterium]|nr:methyltransferase domain-containing protein [Candidatus Binataceae bacterium]
MRKRRPQVRESLERGGPDREAALEQYRGRANSYDFEVALLAPVRRRAINRLRLRRGATVLDVGCGTGLSLAQLRRQVGQHGRVVGIEQSPEMITQARERVTENAWQRVNLVCAPVQDAELPRAADAALFHFTHDILQSPAAVANVIEHLRPGARVVAAGLKWAPPWAMPANLFVLPAALRSVTSLDGLEEPWSLLKDSLGGIEVEELLAGSVYIASGTVPPKRD